MIIDVEARGLHFTADIEGPDDGPLVLCLHGYPQTKASYRSQLSVLGQAGYRAVAVDQRGYSPGARPVGVEHYGIDDLVADPIAIAEALGSDRFHLVGHDWGGAIAWQLAARHPERLLTLTVLSRPHPAAFIRALTDEKSGDDQQHRSRHHKAFDDPATADRLLEDGARRLRRGLVDNGVPDDAVDLYLTVLGHRDALEAALSWYRAARKSGGLGADSTGTANIIVPTLYIWGDADLSVGRPAAEWTADHVDAPYTFAELAGVNHFATDEAPNDVNHLLLAHLKGSSPTALR